MSYRLLVDLEAVSVLDSLPAATRRRLLIHLGQLRVTPDQFSDAHAQDHVGRRVEISIFAGYAIHYWIDFADRHVKVLALCAAAR